MWLYGAFQAQCCGLSCKVALTLVNIAIQYCKLYEAVMYSRACLCVFWLDRSVHVVFFCCVDTMQSIVAGYDDSFEPQYHDLEPEYEACGSPESVMQMLSVQGRLRKQSDFWLKELEPSSFVKEVITQGYHIPFIQLPEPVYYRNHRSAFEHSQFVEEAIEELVALHCVVQCSQCLVVCSPLSVVVSAREKSGLCLIFVT